MRPAGKLKRKFRKTPGHSNFYTNDILGNRTAKSVSGVTTTYGWDDLNRMTSLTVGSATTNYAYMADGMRVNKSSSTGSTVYRYDGQMGIEDVELNSSSSITAITRNALGARGIDAISRTTSSGTTVAYPLYDAHGNNVGMLTKSGSSWSLNDERTYDAWGQVRSGATTGDQKGRYCAQMGHKQDDESGLVYMRARYYEPISGRFTREDTKKIGLNWYAYCRNDPIQHTDFTGNSPGDLGDQLEADLAKQAMESGEGSSLMAAFNILKGKIGGAVMAFNMQIMSWLGTTSTAVYNFVYRRNGIVVTCDDGNSLRTVFIDLTDKFNHGGAHLDFQSELLDDSPLWHDPQLFLENIEKLFQVK